MAYCTTVQVKEYLGIGGAGDDALILQLIESAQAAIDRHCGRTFEAASDATRFFSMCDVTGRQLLVDVDLAQIATVTNNADGTTPEIIPSTDYITNPRNETPYYGITIKRSSSSYWTYTDDMDDAISIEGRWAYSVTAPDDIVQACIRWVGFLYRQKDAQVFDVTAVPEAGVITIPQGIPADVKQLLRNYRRPY